MAPDALWSCLLGLVRKPLEMLERPQSISEVAQSIFEVAQSNFEVAQSILEVARSIFEVAQSIFEVPKRIFWGGAGSAWRDMATPRYPQSRALAGSDNIQFLVNWVKCDWRSCTLMQFKAWVLGNSLRLDVPTWRPSSLWPKDEMRRFFIGGNPQLEDLR